MASSSSSFSSSSANYPWKYDVFLSFRGEDARNNFVGHLYQSLCRKGLHRFIDDKQLERGKDISPELLKAIEQSRLAVIVFSENYASSSWCLDELVKILECKEVKAQKVVPVFYKVDPSHVRKQQGSYAEAFNKHEKDYAQGIWRTALETAASILGKRKRDYAQKMEKVKIWRTALETAASISGWHTEKTANGHEATCVQEITNDIYEKLGSPISSIIIREQGLVGIDSGVEKVCSMLDIGGSNAVRVVGIWGMGGIGKTTLARVVYDRIVHQFEDSSFLASEEFIGKHGLEALRKELNSLASKLYHERVLIVLDDADAIAQQLDEILISNSWDGSGSRIIITSRDAHLLAQLGVEVDTRYEVEALNENGAWQLFSLKAFKKSNPPQDYVHLSHQMLHYAAGLPLALEVLGSSLFRRDQIEWEDILGKLKKVGNKDILAVLEISFDRLDELEKQIFLDIACFFQGYPRDSVTSILESCDFYPTSGINTLIERSLVTVSPYKYLQMHALIQKMGQHIVRKEDKEPGRRSRIWNSEDAYQALMENTVTDSVEGISLCFHEPKEVNCNPEVFKKMNKLRVLILRNARISPGAEIECLSNKLVFLDWNDYPSKSLPTSFIPDNLVELHMTDSKITEFWKGRKTLGKLKILDLTGSQKLERTPDFAGLPNLKELIICDCTTLEEVHPSIAFHKKLVRIRMNGCSNLKSLADNIHLESLEHLNLSGCLKFEKFPEIVGKMEKLKILYLTGSQKLERTPDFTGLPNLEELILCDCTALEVVHPSIAFHKKLIGIWMNGCSNLKSLADNIHLESLVRLNLSGCLKLEKFPEIVGKMEKLWELNLDRTGIKELPSSIQQLSRLKKIDARGSAIKQIPSSVTLRYLNLRGCKGPMTWESGSSTTLSSSLPRECDKNDMGLALNCSTNLCCLINLDLTGAHILDGVFPNDLVCLQNLCRLYLSETNIEALPKLPSRLEVLCANNCPSLRRVVPGVFSRCSERLEIILLLNCFGLVQNQEDSFLDTVMQWFSQRISSGKQEEVLVALPGNEIPKWFTCQCTTVPEISVSYPSRCSGIAFCAVNEDAVSLPKGCRVNCYPIPFHRANCYSRPGLRGPHLFVVYVLSLYIPTFENHFVDEEQVTTKIGYRPVIANYDPRNFKRHDEEEEEEEEDHE